MRYAPLPSQSELLSLFDYRDGCLYWKTAPKRSSIFDPAGYECKIHGYRFIVINKVLYRAHRLIWKMFHGRDPHELDHINRNRTDNRIENLREVTRSENNFNHPVRKDNKCGVRGVSWHSKTNKWRVGITFNKKTMYLGCFKDLELACLVAEEARDKYHRIDV